jgi:hypothetical protein
MTLPYSFPMQILDLIWAFAMGIAFFLLPGLPLVAILRLERKITLKMALPLIPMLSISTSLIFSIILHFSTGIKLGAEAWGASILIITIMACIIYVIILKSRNENALNHFKWSINKIWKGSQELFFSKKALPFYVILVLAIGFSLALRWGNLHPVHTDEWHYWAHADAMMSQGNWSFTDYYYGYNSGYHSEVGFLIFIGSFNEITGLDWNSVFLLLPLIITVIIILLLYKIGQAFDAGLPCALFAAILPTTLRFLGMGFLVPLSLGIILILSIVYLVLYKNSSWTLPIIVLAMGTMVLVHPPSAVAGLVVVFAAGLVNIIFKRWKFGFSLLAFTFLIIILALFLPGLWISDFWAAQGFNIFNTGSFFLPSLTLENYIRTFGFWLFIFGFIGALLLLKEKKYQTWAYVIILSCVGSLVLIFRYILDKINNVQALHDRVVFIFFSLLVIPTGKTIAWVWKSSKIATAIIVITILITAGYMQKTTQYYEIVNETEYKDFNWIKDNLNESYDKAILDPWKAIAFSPITKKMVYYQIPQGPDTNIQTMIGHINTFFDGQCSDTGFLIDNGISIVYTTSPVTNDALIQVHPNVYVLNYIP